MYAGVDAGTEDVTFRRDLLFSSMSECSFSTGNIPALDAFLNEGGVVAGDLGDDTDVL